MEEKHNDVFGLVFIKCAKGQENKLCDWLFEIKENKKLNSSIESNDPLHSIMMMDIYFIAGGYDIVLTIASASTRSIEEFVIKTLRTKYGGHILDTQTLVGVKATKMEPTLRQ